MTREAEMATKTDFTEAEWDQMHKGATGSGMLVSLSDRDFTDTFGEVSAMGKYIAGQQMAASSQLIRELAHVGGTGFGLTAHPDKVRTETMAALSSTMTTLAAKSPEDVEPYRAYVLGIAEAVAGAKGGGTSDVETAMIVQIKAALAGQ
jgi:hypothetical protein